MPSFSRDEENRPVLTQSLASATPTTASNAARDGPATVFGKAVDSRITNHALVSVDGNAPAVNGRRPIRYSPPPPTSPPPSPPSRLASRPQLTDARPLFSRRKRSSTFSDTDDDDDDTDSAASSADMNGHGGSTRRGGGSSSVGAASSQTTTAPPDEDLRLDGYYEKDDKLNGGNDDGEMDNVDGRTASLTSSNAPTIPERAPPPPPQQTTPPLSSQQLAPSSPSPLPSALPTQNMNRPEAPSQAPPPPPKPETLSRKTKPLSNGGPISVPNPMADRTRIGNPHPQSQSLPPAQHQNQNQPQSAWTNGTSTEESELTDTSPDDTLPRHSVASTGASSVQPSIADVYSGRQAGSRSSDVHASSSSNGGLSTAAAAGPASASASVPPTTATTAATPESTSASQFSAQSPNPQLLQAGQPSILPHRFSSPPAYNPAAGSSSSVAGTHLSPTAGLKHRHTLEVPKATPARNSREGIDSSGVYASGRFSPTAAGGVGNGSISSIGGRRASLSLVRRNTRSLHSDLPRDEVVPDEDALRWAEAYRQKRASKKRRMEQDDDQVLVGTKVDETHQNWVAAYNMLTGIRVSVSRTNAKLDRPLTDEDFQAKQKSTFDIAGNELVPSAKYDFKFKDYAPWVFRHLRQLFHLDPADYLMSLAGKYILSELGSPGKSGSFFYFSRDYRYIIKTIHHSEHKFLRKILKDYYKHVTENPNTLLSQFFGLHRVKMPYGRKIHFVVMNNLFPPHRDIHQTFDLKGSTIGRDYPEELLSDNPRATLKDLNWLRRHQHLELGIIKKRLFLEQLHKDVKLLQRLQIMDYSLLVGTHDLRRGNDENLRGKILQVFEPRGEKQNADGLGTQSVLMRTPSKLEHQRKTRELRQMLKSERPIPIGESSNKMPDELDDNKQSIFYKDDGGFQATHLDNTAAEEVYYLGVIDCLTHYGIVKKIEHFWKGLSNDATQISALPPQEYGDRFLKFMSGITMSPEDAAREAQDRGKAAGADAAAASSSAAPNADTSGHAGDGPGSGFDGVATASGRDKGVDAAGHHLHGGWSGNLRHRGGASGSGSNHGNSNGNNSGVDSSNVTTAHRAAEFEAQKASAANETETTQTTVPIGNGTLLPGLVAGSSSSSQSTPALPSLPSLPLLPPMSSVPSMPNSPPPPPPHNDRRESMQQPVLPIVDEANENSSTGGRSHSSRFSSHTAASDDRPATPAKDKDLPVRLSGGSASAVGSHRDPSPPTPPATGYLKPESADSGYGVSGTRSRSGTVGTVGSGRKLKMQLSRDSLDKELPPLPKLDGAA
ncbi:1-phosphatidylinositol-4-phosphate 5-kinase [Sporothrix schenckii 1099-18]|uniref:1-phosphatidylinositol-4-phosphate 5-kinase n=1 Tax=Sporothrix schenckii 1099-18 TaxID=1397361 RepID=A0A0F2M1B6_SPOSC|nr:1-phosphatidylinositol-4-phosphate 5-kinase [Sporothrix schenckii 1099-18]KJR83497.1 1-phosphatidylinositol-4-phosphate 5-kinase [Sporothrix schenckii 1099-18]